MKRFVRVGLLLELGRAYGRRLCEGVSSVALARGWELVSLSLADVQRDDARVDALIARVYDERMANALKALGKPCVDVFANVRGTGFSTVDADHAAIGRLAAEHFLEHRFSTFAYCGYDGVMFSDLRRDSFVQRLACSHFDCICYKTSDAARRDFMTNVLRNERLRMGPDDKQMLAWVRKLPKPVAVFCSHDLRAYQLAQTCRRIGIDVPREVAILGADDDVIVCSFSSPMLSSVDPDAFGVGRAAAETLAKLLENPSARPFQLTVPPKGVVMRPSTETYPLDPPWLSEALVYINRNVGANITSADVGRHLGMSHTPIDRAFRTVLGTSVQKEIVRARLSFAEHLLKATSQSVGEIASRVGFSRLEYFCTSFRTRYGVTPSVYRACLVSGSAGREN